MSHRRLSYTDAVRLLGANDNRIVAIADQLGGLAASAAVVATLGAVDFFGVRDELLRWGRAAARGLRDRLTGIGRFDRTQRLVAAHAVIVITSFYDAAEECLNHAGIDLSQARLSGADHVALVHGGPFADAYSALLADLTRAVLPIPSASRSFAATASDLWTYYSEARDNLFRFLPKLSAFEGVVIPSDVHQQIPDRAIERYEIAYRQLAVDVPEFAVWASMLDAEASRFALTEMLDQLAQLSTGLSGIGELLATMSTGAAADQRRRDLALRYRNRLDRPVLDPRERPENVLLPALGDAYVNPACRVQRASPQAAIAAESWWQKSPVVEDIQAVLVAHLTGPDATAAPLVVLGQPGAGKSVLTQVLATRLPESDFLAIRVELRVVPADASIQAQIEAAILDATGEHIDWPDMARSAGGALPVVMLDGFDELLQATGLNRADYLEQVQEFQQREAELGRPVAVLVTTRTAVADRARCPAGTVALRLEPFDDERVSRWLNTWNATNSKDLKRRGLRPLSLSTALAHGDLARQPLLLLLLAIYDAADNRLQQGGGFGRADLYEKLFRHFAEREVHKRHVELTADDERRAIETEIDCLAAVAIAMFNRGGQVITEVDLDRDLPPLLAGRDTKSPLADAADVGRALTAAQIAVGRFFFVLESRARRDTGGTERAFEFLHSTFGEYLVAWGIVRNIKELVAERTFLRGQNRSGGPNAGLLRALSSFTVLCSRALVLEFTRGLLAGLPSDHQDQCRSLLVELLREAERPPESWSLSGYEPVPHSAVTRYAVFSANLVQLIVTAASEAVPLTELYAVEPERNWRRHALLWKGHLADDWTNLLNAVQVTGYGPGALVGPAATSPPIRLSDAQGFPAWVHFPDYSAPPATDARSVLCELAFVRARSPEALLAQVLVPIWQLSESTLDGSEVRLLLELRLQRATPLLVGRRVAAYSTLIRRLRGDDQALAVVLRQLREDVRTLGPDVVLALLRDTPTWMPEFFEVAAALARWNGADIVRELIELPAQAGEAALAARAFQVHAAFQAEGVVVPEGLYASFDEGAS